jgi:hypothetical protein
MCDLNVISCQSCVSFLATKKLMGERFWEAAYFLLYICLCLNIAMITLHTEHIINLYASLKKKRFCKVSSAFVIANLSKHLVYFVQIVHKFFLHKIHILTQSILYPMHKCERNEINYSP